MDYFGLGGDAAVAGALERLGDRLVEAIARGSGNWRLLSADQRVKLAAELLEGTSMKVFPR